MFVCVYPWAPSYVIFFHVFQKIKPLISPPTVSSFIIIEMEFVVILKMEPKKGCRGPYGHFGKGNVWYSFGFMDSVRSPERIKENGIWNIYTVLFAIYHVVVDC